MGRPKGGKNRKWTNEERITFVLMCEDERLPYSIVAEKNDIPLDTLKGWVKKYRAGGISRLNPKKPHPGNKFAALHSCKTLSEEERLRLMVEKLRIENERLKKGYIVKGVGANKEFVTLSEMNSK